MIYGYVRISKRGQDPARQERNIKAVYPYAVILKETYTGTTSDRPEWQKLIRKAGEGDQIIFDSVSRMSRNAEEGFRDYEALFHKGVKLTFLKEPMIDTETYRKTLQDAVPMTGTAVDLILEGVNRYMLELAREQIRLAFLQSEKEVEDLRQRTKEGIETARLKGKTPGRRKGQRVISEKEIRAKREILAKAKDFGGAYTDADLIRVLGISKPAYYKYKKQLKEEKRNPYPLGSM